MIVGDRPICLTGGADGADLQWGMCAGARGDMVVHWSFDGHRTRAPISERAVLTASQLAEADPALIKAAVYLQRKFPPTNDYSRSLLQRNWFQVRDAASLYAVAPLKPLGIDGGTAWAVAMFLGRFSFNACAAYLFDLTTSTWRVWDGNIWTETNPPPPNGVWAGIGSRVLPASGKAAIRDILGWTKTSHIP